MKNAFHAAALALLPVALVAAETRTDDAKSPADDSQVILMGYGQYNPSAALYKGGATGTVRRTLGDGEIIRTGHISEDTTLDLDYEAKWTHNAFSGTVAPYGDTESHFFGAHVAHMFDEHYGIGFAGGVELASETEADLFRDGIRGGAGASFVWKVSDTFSTETGLTIQSQFGQDPSVSPYVVWKWNVSKNFDLGIRATGLTNGAYGVWWVTDDKATSVKLSLSYDTANYALRPGAFAEGYYTNDTALRLVVTQFLSKNLFVAARGEITLDHRENFFRDNNDVGTFKTKPAPTFALIVGVRL